MNHIRRCLRVDNGRVCGGRKSSLIGYCISCSTVLVWSLVG